ncbi:phosphatase PAP2 family protein [Carboxylicivirga sediminis]|uniref:Phosphatase PAP2 family protein n=1 Tax=Carboxylicivirga sediminis TaxID=2006564 RepID=A0A941F7Q4_9BACT|nr:phosphatase PAP2 family protein [Carboxylicivirga sediminis]MBR8537175.1 phosphatase PAP2 family protein [Carboxylicivirga sediminis]
MIKKLTLTLAGILVCYTMHAQYADETQDYQLQLKNYRKNVTRISVIGTSCVALAFLVDQPLNTWMQNNQGGAGDAISDVANVFGEKLLIVPAVGLSYGAGYVFKDEKLRSTSWNAIKAIATTAAATEIIKISLGRARPFVSEGAFEFDPFNGNDAYKSMPSGHVSLAFAAFTPYAETYSRWLYVAPASVAFARMYKNKHWLSDTVLGAGLGFLSGWMFTHHPRSNVQVSANGVVVFF